MHCRHDLNPATILNLYYSLIHPNFSNSHIWNPILSPTILPDGGIGSISIFQVKPGSNWLCPTHPIYLSPLEDRLSTILPRQSSVGLNFPPKNHHCNVTSLSATFFGTLQKEKKKIGIEFKTDFMIVTLPPKDKCLWFYFGNFLTSLDYRIPCHTTPWVCPNRDTQIWKWYEQ